MDPREPLPYRFQHALIDELTSAAIDEIAWLAGPGSALAIVQIRHLGGALGRESATSGARSTLPGEICIFSLGVVMDDEMGRATQATLSAIDTAVAPYRTGYYPNFVEEAGVDGSEFFDPATWQRLREIKSLYDPSDLFKANHPIPGATNA